MYKVAFGSFTGYGVWSLVIASIVQNFVVTFMYIYFNNAFYLPSIKFGQAKDLFSYTKRSFIAELLMFFSNKTPAIIGAKIYGVTQLGYFSVAGQLSALILTKVMPAFNQVGFTTFSRLNETGNHESIEKYIKDLMVVTSIITFPTFWGLGYTSGKWLPLLIGETWSASVSLLLVMTLVIPFRIFSEILSLAFEAQDKTDIIIKIRIYSLLLSISLIAIFYTLQFGIINLAFSGLASGIFSFILLASIPVDKKCITLDIKIGRAHV